MDEKLNSQYVKLLIVVATVFYVSSLFITAFSPTSNAEDLLGYEVLLLGWVQTVLMVMATLTALVHFDISAAFSAMLMALPWLANACYLITIVCLLSGFGQRLCLISSISGLLCSLTFMLNPVAVVGADFKSIPVEISLGGGLWFCTGIILLVAYYVKSLPTTN